MTRRRLWLATLALVLALAVPAGAVPWTSLGTPTCGTGCAGIQGNDRGGVITLTTGASAATINFSGTLNTTPACVSESTSTSISTATTAVSTSAVTFSTSASTSTLYFICWF